MWFCLLVQIQQMDCEGVGGRKQNANRLTDFKVQLIRRLCLLLDFSVLIHPKLGGGSCCSIVSSDIWTWVLGDACALQFTQDKGI